MERQSTRKLFKLVIALAALFTLALSVFAFGACGGEEQQTVQPPETHTHAFKSSGKTDPTCGAIGVETFTCSCGDTYQIITPATGKHKWGADGYCETCGLPNFGADVKIPQGLTAQQVQELLKDLATSKDVSDLGEKVNDVNEAVEGIHQHTLAAEADLFTIEGTCTSYALTIKGRKCDCGATFITSIVKSGTLGHTPGTKQTVEKPTCKDFGHWNITCTKCGVVLQEGDINTVPHKEAKTPVHTDPTCTETGSDVYYCEYEMKDGKPNTDDEGNITAHVMRTETIEKAPHTMPEGSKPDDCTTAGGKFTYECEVCHQRVEADFAHSEHVWTYSDVKMIECGVSATATQSCKHCKVKNEGVTINAEDNAELVKTLAAAGWKAEHDYTGTASTTYENFVLTGEGDKLGCTEVTTTQCVNCTTPKVESKFVHHNWQIDDAALKTSLGDTNHVVPTDGEVHPQFGAVLWGKFNGDKNDIKNWYNPYCDKDAYVYFYCVDSGHAENDAVRYYAYQLPRAEHALTILTVKEMICATATAQAGYAVEICQHCSYNLGDTTGKTNEELAALYKAAAQANTNLYFKEINTPVAHKADKDTLSYTGEGCKAPTCLANGVGTYECSVCHETISAQEIEGSKLEHEYVFDSVVKQAHMCEPGVEKWVCKNGCENVELRDVEAPMDHVWMKNEDGSEYVRVSKAPTCTQPGEGYWICLGCNTIHEVSIDALGHTFAGDRVGMKNSYGIIKWNFGATNAEFHELFDNGGYQQCRDTLYSCAYCATCGEMYGEIQEVLPSPHSFEVRHDFYDLSKKLSPTDFAAKIEEEGLYQRYEIMSATCEDHGTYGYKCLRCGQVIFQGYSDNLGHWYYDISREEAEGLSADQLAEHLKVVGKGESACLSPKSVTVECYYCGVRYSNGDDSSVAGHKWSLLVQEGNNGVLCGQFLNSKTLAYCESCGLVIDLTGIKFDVVKDQDGNPTGQITFDKAETYAKYIGVEDLDKTQKETLANLLDVNNNLCVKVEDKITPATTSLVTEAYKSDKVQLHKFVDDPKYRIMLEDGDCSQPTAYVLVCSICGLDENDEPVIRADKDIEIPAGDKTFYDYMQEYTRAYVPADPALEGVQEAYKALGYTLISKTKNITVKDAEGNDKLVSLRDLYLEYVTAEKLGLELEEGEELIAPSWYYTWYNFAAFTYSNEGHQWLTNNKECEVDPILTMIFEDYLGTTNATILKNANGTGLNGTKWMTADETMTFEVALEKYHGSLGADVDAQQKALAELKVTYAKYLNVLMKDYRAVVEYLDKTTPSISYPANYKGISNWCKRAADGKCTLTATAGFKPVVDHTDVYKIASTTAVQGRTYYDKTFTFGLEDGKQKLPTTFDKAAVEKWKDDLLFVQYLKTNAETIRENEDPNLLTILTEYEDEGYLKYDVVRNDAITCIVLRTCCVCGRTGIEGNHQMDRDDPVYGANCQRGAKCVVCGAIVGSKDKTHNLVDINEYIAALPAKVQVGYKADGITPDYKTKDEIVDMIAALVTDGTSGPFKSKKNGGTAASVKWSELKVNKTDSECWLEGNTAAYGELSVCTGCLEAKLGLLAPEFTANDDISWKSKEIDTSAKDAEINYKIEWHESVANPGTEKVDHTFVLDAKGVAAKKLLAKFSDKFNNITAAQIEALEADEANEMVKAYVENDGTANPHKITYTNSTQEAKGTFTAKVDEEGYLVVHFKETENDAICVGTEYNMDICFACAIHFAGTLDPDEDDGTFGVRTTTDTSDKHLSDEDGKYNDSVTTQLHVYATAKDWTYDPANPDYVYVVCLRCSRWDEQPVGGKVTGWKNGDAKGNWFYIEKATDWDAAPHNTIPDASTLKTRIGDSGKAKYYDGAYSYATTSTEAAAELKETVAEGGVVEVAAGVEVELDSTKQSVLSVAENTEIKLAEGASLKIDATEAVVKQGPDANASATAIYVNNGKSLKIEGGVVDVMVGTKDKNGQEGKGNATAIGAVGKGTVIEFVNTVFKTNSSVQAETGAKIVVKDSTILSHSGMAISTNHELTAPEVTYEFDNAKILSYNVGGVGLLVNNENVSVTAKDSLFYGTCTGAWIRSGNELSFTNCAFVTGNAVTANTTWGSGTYCPQEAKAALLVGGAGDGYDDVKAMSLTNCNAVISYEWFANRNAARQDTDITKADDSLVKFNDETNEFTYAPYTGTKAVGGKKFAVGAYGEHVVNVTFDDASARNFGLTNSYLVENTNVFLAGSAVATQITIKIGTNAVTINKANP